jgi:hemoglobin
MAVAPLLDHRPALQQSLTRALEKARGSRNNSDRAFALRAALDEAADTLQKAPAAAKSLYERLGGEKAIAAVIDDFVARAAANPKVNFTRQGTDVPWEPTPENVALLKRRLVQLVGMVTGGPQKYEGRSMKDAHRGMRISDAEFDALAADLKASLDRFQVPAREQQELLQIVGSTRADIVERMK